jgi:phospholipid/cholesterol/gamma-HCH transport system permease protein
VSPRGAMAGSTSSLPPGSLPTGQGWTAQIDRNGVVVRLVGDWVAGKSGAAADQSGHGSIEQIADAAGRQGIAFDSAQLGHWDSSLLIFIASLRKVARERGIAIDENGLPQPATRLLALIADTSQPARSALRKTPLVDRVGVATIDSWNEAVAVTGLIGDTVLSGGAAVRGRLRMRGGDLLACIYDAGVAALPIVSIVNILVGGIVAFVGAVQLRRFGADIFIADLVGVAMVREMTALMTAIVMSGRTGGAYAAQISTMLGNEEIDALRAIGIPVYDYLILPRLLALTFTMPLLYLYGCALGIFGGFVVAVAMLNLSPNSFIDETRISVGGSQILFGLVKSVAFGILIAIVGCRAGLGAGRSAADVGRAATTAVVLGIVGVIALDAVFAVCANALDF